MGNSVGAEKNADLLIRAAPHRAEQKRSEFEVKF